MRLRDFAKNIRFMNKKRCLTTEDQLYIASLIFLFVIVGFVVLRKIMPDLIIFNAPCLIKEITGLCCPSCGGTRSFLSFLHGDFIASFVYNPAAFYAICYYIIFFISNTLRIITKDYIKGLKFKFVHLYIGIFLVIFNLIMKNYLHCYYGINLY